MIKEQRLKQTEVGMIPEDWDITYVESIASHEKYSLSMGPFGSNITKDNFLSRGVPVIRGNNLTAYRFLDSDFVFVSEQKANELLSSNARANDIVITHRGTLGQVAIIPENSKYKRYVVSQSGMKLTCDRQQVDPDFVFYWLKSPRGQQELLKNTSQTGVPAIAQPLSSLRKVMLPKPHIVEQHAIAKVFSALDSKIELNHQMDKTLEAIGQATFKHWFMDFEFPNEEGKPYKSSGGEMVYNEELGKEMPKSWETKPIDEIADFLNGLALQNYPPENETDVLPVIKIRELRQGISESTDRASANIPKQYIVDDGDVLFSWSGSLEVVIWASGKGALNQHLFKVTSANFPKWFYYHWILQYLPEYRHIAEGKATTMGHIQRHHLKSSLVLVPDEETLQRMDKIQVPIIEKLIQIGVQSRRLSQIRDMLLPKLMSGKIRVPVEVR